MPPNLKTAGIALACSALLIASDALAFRCGNRLIREGMPESEVTTLCGEPIATRYLGYVMRPYTIRRAAGLSSLSESQNVYAGFREELLVKELLFNFGPRKLMRLVRFEGGRVVSIETAGYGRIPQKE